jgi:type II secretory pathway pseudopilin PulG
MKTPPRTRTRPGLQRTAALTLVELLVVLSLVAVLSTVALRSVTGLVDEKRYDANVQQLEEIERAVLGHGEKGGFVGDIGRLPIASGDIDVELLAELWNPGAAAFAPYMIRTPAGDPEIRLGTGWRGPYLDLGVNRRRLVDGFGRPFLLWQADGITPAIGGTPIAIVQSLGFDGAPGGIGMDEDLSVVFEATDAGAFWRSPVNVMVVRDQGAIEGDDQRVVVRIYGANEIGDLHTVVQRVEEVPADGILPPIVFPSVPYGAKVLRAYQIGSSPSTIDPERAIIGPTPHPDPSPTPPPIEASHRSTATHVVVGRFTDTITLTLYPPPPISPPDPTPPDP